MKFDSKAIDVFVEQHGFAKGSVPPKELKAILFAYEISPNDNRYNIDIRNKENEDLPEDRRRVFVRQCGKLATAYENNDKVVHCKLYEIRKYLPPDVCEPYLDRYNYEREYKTKLKAVDEKYQQDWDEELAIAKDCLLPLLISKIFREDVAGKTIDQAEEVARNVFNNIDLDQFKDWATELHNERIFRKMPEAEQKIARKKHQEYMPFMRLPGRIAFGCLELVTLADQILFHEKHWERRHMKNFVVVRELVRVIHKIRDVVWDEHKAELFEHTERASRAFHNEAKISKMTEACKIKAEKWLDQVGPFGRLPGGYEHDHQSLIQYLVAVCETYLKDPQNTRFAEYRDVQC